MDTSPAGAAADAGASVWATGGSGNSNLSGVTAADISAELAQQSAPTWPVQGAAGGAAAAEAAAQAESEAPAVPGEAPAGLDATAADITAALSTASAPPPSAEVGCLSCAFAFEQRRLTSPGPLVPLQYVRPCLKCQPQLG